jgi:small subunit ribosomal protein S8
MSDPIADMLTIMRNGLAAGHKNVYIKHSKLKYNIISILKEEGYIEGYSIQDAGHPKILEITLKYHGGKPSIEKIEKVSKQSRRIYSSYSDIPLPYQGLGSVIMSTSKGVMTGRQAKRMQIGGEVLCAVF